MSNYRWSNYDIACSIKALALSLGRTPTKRDIDADRTTPSNWVIYSRYGSMKKALKAAEVVVVQLTKTEALETLPTEEQLYLLLKKRFPRDNLWEP